MTEEARTLTREEIRVRELRRRSTVDWGEAPKYNEEYRKIRWPGIKRPDGDRPNLNIEPIYNMWIGERRLQVRQGRHSWDEIRPAWLRIIREDKRLKQEGRWSKAHTGGRLIGDLKFCIKENIPFKTNTLEYRPLDQWVYINGRKAVKYDIESGRLTHFMIERFYDKIFGFFLRKLGIYVRRKSKGIEWVIRQSWRREDIPVLVGIQLNELYRLDSVPSRDQYFFQIRHREVEYVPAPGVIGQIGAFVVPNRNPTLDIPDERRPTIRRIQITTLPTDQVGVLPIIP